MADETKQRCRGISRQSGERCRCKAVKGSNYCMFHGGGALGNKGGVKKGTPKPPGAGGPPPKGNTNALKHGAYTPRLQPDEQPMYEALLAEYMEDVPNPTVTDRHAISRLAVIETKWHTAVTQGAPADALDVLHRLLHRELKALQITRESKDSSANQGNSPAEVVAALLMKVREHALSLQKQAALPQDTGDGVVIEVDAGDDGGGTDA